MEASQSQPPFEVTGQTAQPDIDDSGNPSISWRINFKTRPSGVSSFVDVAGADYTPEKVAKILTREAENIEQVHRLGRAPE